MPKKAKSHQSTEALHTFEEVKNIVKQAVHRALEEREIQYKGEIQRLERERDMYKRLYESRLPRGRGRPKKSGGFLSALFGDNSLPALPKKKGAPVVHKNPGRTIENWNFLRDLAAKALHKKSVRDSEALNYILETDKDWPDFSREKKQK